MMEAHQNEEFILDLAVADNGGWFLSTNKCNGWFFECELIRSDGETLAVWKGNPEKSRVQRVFARVKSEHGVGVTAGDLKYIAFMPGEAGYYAVIKIRGVDTPYYEGVPDSLERYLTADPFKAVQSLSEGVNKS